MQFARQAEAEAVLCKKLGIAVDQALNSEYPGADNTLVLINKDDFWRRLMSALSNKSAIEEFLRLFAGRTRTWRRNYKSDHVRYDPTKRSGACWNNPANTWRWRDPDGVVEQCWPCTGEQQD